MIPPIDSKFTHYYKLHCKYLALQGLQPKTIETYSWAIRRIGEHFHYEIEGLSQDQLVDYFHALLLRLSWSTVRRDWRCCCLAYPFT